MPNTGFDVRDIENLREHYARTLRHWARGLEDHRAEAIQLASCWGDAVAPSPS